MATEAPGRKKRVVKPPEERRRDIIGAALRLFRERGFDETTVQDIADAAGVATGTVYLYFPSKEHVLLAIHEEFHHGLEARFEEVALELVNRRERGEGLGHEVVIDEIFDALWAYNRQQRDLWEVMCRYMPRLEGRDEAEELDRIHIEFMANAFRAGQEMGWVHTPDAEMTAYLLTAVNISIGQAIGRGDPPDIDRLLLEAKRLYHKVLGPDPA